MRTLTLVMTQAILINVLGMRDGPVYVGVYVAFSTTKKTIRIKYA